MENNTDDVELTMELTQEEFLKPSLNGKMITSTNTNQLQPPGGVANPKDSKFVTVTANKKPKGSTPKHFQEQEQRKPVNINSAAITSQKSSSNNFALALLRL